MESVFGKSVLQHLAKLSTDSLTWIATVAFHLSTIPTLISLVSGINDRVPTVDTALFVWVGLLIIMVRSVIVKDHVNILINSIGFFTQVCLFTMIVFK